MWPGKKKEKERKTTYKGAGFVAGGWWGSLENGDPMTMIWPTQNLEKRVVAARQKGGLFLGGALS